MVSILLVLAIVGIATILLAEAISRKSQAIVIGAIVGFAAGVVTGYAVGGGAAANGNIGNLMWLFWLLGFVAAVIGILLWRPQPKTARVGGCGLPIFAVAEAALVAIIGFRACLH